MTLSDAREYILDEYPTEEFRQKVAKMKPNQIYAIYFRIINRKERQKEEGGQLSMFDLFEKEMSPIYEQRNEFSGYGV